MAGTQRGKAILMCADPKSVHIRKTYKSESLLFMNWEQRVFITTTRMINW